MKTTMINIKADKQVKEEAQAIVEELGLSLSGIINAFLKQLIRTREVRFIAGNTMTPYLERVIAEAEKDYKSGKLGTPMTLEEAINFLDKNGKYKNKK